MLLTMPLCCVITATLEGKLRKIAHYFGTIITEIQLKTLLAFTIRRLYFGTERLDIQ